MLAELLLLFWRNHITLSSFKTAREDYKWRQTANEDKEENRTSEGVLSIVFMLIDEIMFDLVDIYKLKISHTAEWCTKI